MIPIVATGSSTMELMHLPIFIDAIRRAEWGKNSLDLVLRTSEIAAGSTQSHAVRSFPATLRVLRLKASHANQSVPLTIDNYSSHSDHYPVKKRGFQDLAVHLGPPGYAVHTSTPGTPKRSKKDGGPRAKRTPRQHICSSNGKRVQLEDAATVLLLSLHVLLLVAVLM